MANLLTSYMGLTLRNPIIVSSSDLTKTVDKIIQCSEAGAGAVVMKSLFEEQFLIEGDVPESDHSIHPEALDYMRRGGLLEYAPQKMCDVIAQAKKKVDIPVIASINCQTFSLWPSFAKQIEESGADGLELNIYSLPIDVSLPSSHYEDYHLKTVDEVRKAVSIPVSVKLVTQITSLPHLAAKLAQSGCAALVLFNWFLVPDIDINNLGSKSIMGKGDFHQTLRWVGLLAGRVECDIAASGGIQNSGDVIKQILAGASAAQICSLFYQKGLNEIPVILEGMRTWMKEHGFSSIDDFKGDLSFKKQELSFRDLGEAGSYFRAQYLKAYSK
jgi:dihydroorotate dehydrogenase (fumarate)